MPSCSRLFVRHERPSIRHGCARISCDLTSVLLSAFADTVQDDDNLKEGLRFARDVRGELRTSQLNPQKYYELYKQVFDELSNLRVRGTALCGNGRGMAARRGQGAIGGRAF